jgi:transcription initiation factor TFIIB
MNSHNKGSSILTNCQIEDLFFSADPIEASNSSKKEKEDVCPECGNNASNFKEDYSKGIIVCNCGQVIDNIYDTGAEKRNYEGEENETSKFRDGIPYNRLLPQSSLSTGIRTRGKLRKLQLWDSMPYKERSDNIMYKKIHEICTEQGIVKKIELDAKFLCHRVSGTVHLAGKNKGKPIITRGFNRAGIVSACLFIACRRNDESRSTKEIASYFEIEERDVNKGIRSMLTILNDDNIVKDIGTSEVIHFIKRKCDELQVTNRHAHIAITIAKNIDRLNIASNHTTYSLAAASILLMAHINNLKNITKKKLSKAFYDLSDVTIGKTFKRIKKLKNILIDNEKVNAILIDVERQKRMRIIPQAVWDKMKEFGVDTSKYVLEGHEAEYEHEYEKDIELERERQTEEFNKYTEELNKYDDLPDEEFYDMMYDQFSEDSYTDYEFIIDDIKNTINELKYVHIYTPDCMDVIYDIHEKSLMLDRYFDQVYKDLIK